MAKIPFFSADFYAIDDPGAETAQIINLFPEVMESGTGKSVGRLVGTPGLQPFALIGSDPIRSLWMGEGRMFAISGNHLYEVFADGTTEDLGDCGNDASNSPAQIIPNGNEILVISAGYAYRQWNEEDGTHHLDKIRLTAAEYTDLAIGVKAFIYDLVIDGSDNTKVSSTQRPFVAGDVGLDLVIVSGIDFTPATYSIDSVTDEVATLSGAAGVTGATGGVGHILDGNNNTVTSPTLPFVSEDVGGKLIVTAGTGFTPGTYDIDSVADGIATLSSSPGTAGSTGGVATQYAGESITTDADGYLKAGSGTYLDGYGIIAPPDSTNFYISDNVNNGLGFASWSALDKGSKETRPDNILRVFADHQELIVFGDYESVEVWRDTGASNFPLEKDPGAFVHYGLVAKDSVCQLGLSGVVWMGWSSGRGNPQAFYMQGLQPQRISTSALEHIWDTYSDVRDARAFSYSEDGHHFWCISFPTADITWVYDLTASQQTGKPMWHARAYWDGTSYHRIVADCHAYGWFESNADHTGGTWTRDLTHFVGSHVDGSIYVMGLYNYDDGGHPIRRELVLPHLNNENKRTLWHLFQAECLVGDGNDITWTLEYSRDRGKTFVNPRERTATGTGSAKQRLRWLRCGESYDQVFRLSTESAAKVSLTSVWADAEQCSS
jgi:hypothetical protein